MAKPTRPRNLSWGTALRDTRKAAKLSQAECSKRLGFATNIMSTLEHEKRRLSEVERDKLGRILNLTPEQMELIPVLSAEETVKRVTRVQRRAITLGTKQTKKGRGSTHRGATNLAPIESSTPRAMEPTTRRVSLDGPQNPVNPATLGAPTPRPKAAPVTAQRTTMAEQVTKVITSPNLTDSQAARLVGLFNALFTTVIVG